MSKRPVVLYGASGFSGRLIAEFSREYNVPFIAAGRNLKKLQEVLSHVRGMETAKGSVDIPLFVDQLKRDPSTARPDAEIDTARFPRKKCRDAALRMTQ
jgi:short subunit dehydrogenase-like uncharacterized protein